MGSCRRQQPEQGPQGFWREDSQGAKFLSQANACLPCLSQQMQASTSSRQGSNWRQTLGPSLLPWFPRSGFTGKKCKKSDPKRFCYCCSALTFPSLVNSFPEPILFCPSFGFGNIRLCMCMLVYIICTHSYIYNCVQACADRTDNRKKVFKNEFFIRKKESVY